MSKLGLHPQNAFDAILNFQRFKKEQIDHKLSIVERKQLRRRAFLGIANHAETLGHLGFWLAFHEETAKKNGQKGAGVAFRQPNDNTWDRIYLGQKDKKYKPIWVGNPQLRPAEDANRIFLDTTIGSVVPGVSTRGPATVGILEPGVRVDFTKHPEVILATKALETMGQTRLVRAGSFLSALTLENTEEQPRYRSAMAGTEANILFEVTGVDLDAASGRAVAEVTLTQGTYPSDSPARLFLDGLSSTVVDRVLQTA